MFRRENRLAAKREIWSLQRKRPNFSSSFVLKFTRTAGETWKCAVVVSTKISKKAVVRNKIKRRIREVIGDLMGNAKGISMIISPKRVPIDEIRLYREELSFLLNKAKII